MHVAIWSLAAWDREEYRLHRLHDPNVDAPKTLLEFGSLGSLHKSYRAIFIEEYRVDHEYDHQDAQRVHFLNSRFGCEDVAMDKRWWWVRRMKEATCHETSLRTIIKEE